MGVGNISDNHALASIKFIQFLDGIIDILNQYIASKPEVILKNRHERKNNIIFIANIIYKSLNLEINAAKFLSDENIKKRNELPKPSDINDKKLNPEKSFTDFYAKGNEIHQYLQSISTNILSHSSFREQIVNYISEQKSLFSTWLNSLAKKNQIENETHSTMYQLSNDLVIEVLKYLPGNEVAKIERAGKIFKKAVDTYHSQFWHKKMVEDFSSIHYIAKKNENFKTGYARLFNLAQKSYYAVPLQSLNNIMAEKHINAYDARIFYLNDLIKQGLGFTNLGRFFNRECQPLKRCLTDSLKDISEFINKEANNLYDVSFSANANYCHHLLIIEFKLTKKMLEELVNTNQLKKALTYAESVGNFACVGNENYSCPGTQVADFKYLSFQVKFKADRLVTFAEENLLNEKKDNSKKYK